MDIDPGGAVSIHRAQSDYAEWIIRCLIRAHLFAATLSHGVPVDRELTAVTGVPAQRAALPLIDIRGVCLDVDGWRIDGDDDRHCDLVARIAPVQADNTKGIDRFLIG